MTVPAFGAELQRLRLQAGLSLSELSKMVNFSKGHLSKVENSHRPPNLPMARACDAALRADGALIALVDRQITAPRPDAPRPDAVPPDAVPPDGSGTDWSVTFGADGTGRLHVHDGDPAVVAWPAPGGTDPGAVERFTALLNGLVDLGRWNAPGVVLPVVVGTLSTARAMARDDGGRGDGRRMAMVAARLAEFAGWMTQELGDDRGALWWTRQAVELATAADDRDLVAYAHVRRALISMYQADPQSTVELAAMVSATESVAPRVRWLAALREAQGHALGGSRSGFERAFTRALRLHDLVTAETGGIPPLGSATTLDLNAVTEGWCLYDLGRYDNAATVLDTALAGAAGVVNRSTVRFRLRQALAHAARQDVERSCELAAPLLPAVIRLDSATVRADLAAYARLISRWRALPAVNALRPRLNAALSRPATSGMPA